MKRILLSIFGIVAAVAVVESCPWDSSLREYLSRSFWLPFSKHAPPLERKNVRRVSAAFAGMGNTDGSSSLIALRRAYQHINEDDNFGFVIPPPELQVKRRLEVLAKMRSAAQIALNDPRLSRGEHEEAVLVEAKLQMWQAEADEDTRALDAVRQTFEAFLRTTRNVAFASETRGWIAHIHVLLGNDTIAGKLYLDELNREGSNLSRKTLLNSLRLVYGYDGKEEIAPHLAEYFDSAAHAAFAIQMITNPRAKSTPEQSKVDREVYKRVLALADANRKLFDSSDTSQTLTLLIMRTALRMGDPANALQIAAVANGPALSDSPDFHWMVAGAHFISTQYEDAEKPLLQIFQSQSACSDERAAAAYGLVGVYQKLSRPVDQLYYALWLESHREEASRWGGDGARLEDRTLYWAFSGWDLNALLDYQLPEESLVQFVERYPQVKRLDLVRYSLAVRLARADKYKEAAGIYEATRATKRAHRMRQLDSLYQASTDNSQPPEQQLEAKYRFAEFLANNSEKVYFNDALWFGMQRYALNADSDVRLTRGERETFVSGERALRDSQEERWRAYQIANDIVNKAGKVTLGRKAARLALRCLRGISIERFGREEEIRSADIRLSSWLQG